MVRDVNSGGDCGYEETGSMWNSLFFPLNLAVNLKLF